MAKSQVESLSHFRLLALTVLTLAGGLALAATHSATAAGSPGGAASDTGLSTYTDAQRRASKPCAKRKHATPAKRRACLRDERRRKRREEMRRQDEARVVEPSVLTPAPPTSLPPDRVEEPIKNPPEPPPPKPPKEKLPATPRCDLVEGDCDIYSDLFWVLLARYARFQMETGVYPMPPACMEQMAEGKPIACIQMVTYLYPDGSTGGSPWVVDPSAPGGWRFWQPNPPAVTPQCELVPAPCSIYSDTFWELLVKYKPFEEATGAYPLPPECMESGGFCPQVAVFLRPDGTIGGAWMVDPCSPKGWREWEPDPPSC